MRRGRDGVKGVAQQALHRKPSNAAFFSHTSDFRALQTRL